MTLDQAEGRFDSDHTNETAANLLTVATKYWNDEMIGDETFADKVRLVRDWLREEDAKSSFPTPEPDEKGDALIAVAPNGTQIRGTLERAYGVADCSFRKRGPDGRLDWQHNGGVDGLYDNQETVQRNDRTVFVDENGCEWAEDQIRLIRNPEGK